MTFTKAGFVYPVAVIPTDKFIIHRRPHLDEILGAFLLYMFGEKVFPGVRKAFENLVFKFADPIGEESQFFASKELAIGCGEGFLFNEHVVGQHEDGKVRTRIPDQSASTRIAEYVQLLDNPLLKRLLEEALTCDTTPNCGATMLAELLKTDNRRRTMEGKEVFMWAKPALEAIIGREHQIQNGEKMTASRSEWTLVQYFDAWADRKDNARAIARMKVWFQASESQKDMRVTELAHIVEAMSRVSVKKAKETRTEIKEWLQFIFEAMYIGQCDFQDDVVKLSGSPTTFIDAFLDGRHCSVFLSVIESDTQVAHKAARHLRMKAQRNIPDDRKVYGITVVKASNSVFIVADGEIKNCRVGSFGEGPQGILTYASRMLTMLELSEMGLPMPWEHFADFGKPGDSWDGCWHYFIEGGMLMNSSPTHPKLPTQCSLKDIETILKHALDPEAVKVWCRYFD